MKKYLLTGALLIAMLFVITVWFTYPDLIIERLGKPKGPGEYGDIFGAVNALFTSLAFALLIYTALMQREELKLQRKELSLTRKELKKSAQAQRELTEITKANFDLQTSTRKYNIYPDFNISLQNNTFHPLNNSYTHIIRIKPKFYSLRILDVKFNGTGVYFDAATFIKQYGNTVLSLESTIDLVLTASQTQNFAGTIIDIYTQDVDGKHSYIQSIYGAREDKFVLMSPKEIV